MPTEFTEIVSNFKKRLVALIFLYEISVTGITNTNV